MPLFSLQSHSCNFIYIQDAIIFLSLFSHRFSVKCQVVNYSFSPSYLHAFYPFSFPLHPMVPFSFSLLLASIYFPSTCFFVSYLEIFPFPLYLLPPFPLPPLSFSSIPPSFFPSTSFLISLYLLPPFPLPSPLPPILLIPSSH